MDSTSTELKPAAQENNSQLWGKRLSDCRAKLGATRETLVAAVDLEQGKALLAIHDELFRIVDELLSSGIEAEYANFHAERITEQKHLEEQLAYQRLILDHIQDAVITFDKDLTITSWNNGAEKLYGYSAEEALGKKISTLLQAEMTDEERRSAEGQLVESGHFSFEVVQYTKTGERISVEANTISMRDPTGQVIGYFTDNRDITARKKVEEEREQLLLDLEKERNLWHTMVESMLDPVTVCDAQGRATYFNKACARLIQVEIQENVGIERQAEYYRLYHPDGTPFESHELPLQKAALENINVQDIEILHYSPKGEKYVVLWNAAPLHDISGSVTGAVAVGRDITKQREAEAINTRLYEENQQQKELLESIFAAGPFGISVISVPDFTIQMVNPTYRDMTPHPEIDPVGKRVEDVWKLEEGFNIVPLLTHVVQNNECVRNFKLEKIFPNGSQRTYSFHVQLFLHAEKKSLLIVSWDITEIELAREEAEEGRRTLDALMDYIPEGITIADAPDVLVRMISHYGRNLVGLRSEDIVGRPRNEWWKLYHPVEGTPATIEQMPLSRAIWNGEMITDEEWLLENARGEKIPILCNAGPIRNQNGDIIGGISAWREIADRKRAEAALQESEERFRTMADDTPIIIWVTDANGQMEFVNRAYTEFFGVTQEQVRVYGWQPLVHPDDHATYVDEYVNCLREHRVFRAEARVRFHDEWRWIYSHGQPRFSASSEFMGMAGSSIDITDRKKAEQAVQEYSAQLKEYSEQLEARVRERTEELVILQRRLVDNVEAERLWVSQELHDGPMQEIYGLIFELSSLEGAPSDSEWQAEIASILDKLKQINDDLRIVARELRPSSLTPFGLEKAIREYGERFDQEHPELNITLNLMEDDILLPEHVRLSLFRIYQTALTNVIRHAQAENITVNFSFDELNIILEIQDDGEGFEVPKRLRTLARQGHFGLAGAVERAEAIGGTLEVESELGKGTRLRVTVPLGKEGE